LPRVRANFQLDFSGREYLSPFTIILKLQGFEYSNSDVANMENEGGLTQDRDEDVSDLLFRQICKDLGLDERHFIVFCPLGRGKEYIVKCRSKEAYTLIKLLYDAPV